MNSLWEFAKDVAQTQKALAEANEGVSHELTPEEVDDYARALERAQRKLGVQPFNPPAGENF